MNYQHAKGFTLMEMIIAIVVLTAAVSGILFAFLQNTVRSADPMIRQQAIIIAQAYLEEIMLKPYNNPDGIETGSCEEGVGNRILYDDVADYNCTNDTAGAVDQFGNSLSGLGAYNVAVAVADATIGAPAVNARRIDVTVTHDSQPLNIIVTGYRTSYF